MDVLDLGTNTLNNSAIIPSSRRVQSVFAVESPKYSSLGFSHLFKESFFLKRFFILTSDKIQW